MKTRLAICLAVVVSAASLATPAFAQFLPPHEITTSVRSMGLQPVSRPVFRNGRYVLHAVDGRGYEMRVIANALNGRILNVRPVGYRQGPVFVDRGYPPGGYPLGSYERLPPPSASERMAPPPGTYERPPGMPSEPSVIYAPGSNATGPQPPTRPPASAKPAPAKPAAVPKVAAKPAKPPAPATAEASAPSVEPSDTTTGATSSPPAAGNSAIAVPPVQSFE